MSRTNVLDRPPRLIPCGRVSTKDQGDYGTSLETQVEACLGYIQRIGAVPLLPIAEDVSGITRLADRPKGKTILDQLRRGEADGVVWYSVDRFFRDDLEARIQWRDWFRGGVQLHFVDTGQLKNESDILFIIKSWQSNDERGKIRERTQRGKYAKARHGKVMLSNLTPYGYRRDGDTLMVYEPEAAIVQRMATLYISGPETDLPGYRANQPLYITRIAELFFREGVPTPADSMAVKGHPSQRKAVYAQWRPSTIHAILTNKTYIGEWTFGKSGKDTETYAPVKVKVPAILDKGTFLAIQKRLQLNKQYSKRHANHDYLLTGHVRCGICGRRAFGRVKYSYYQKKKTGTALRYYVCVSLNSATRNDISDHHAVCFRAEGIEEQVWAKVRAVLEYPENISQGIRIMQNHSASANAQLESQIAGIDVSLAQLTAQDGRLLSAYVRGLFSDEQLASEKKTLNDERARLTEQRNDLCVRLTATVTEEQLNTFEMTCHQIKTGLDTTDYETKRWYLDLLGLETQLVVEEDGTKTSQSTVLVNGIRMPI